MGLPPGDTKEQPLRAVISVLETAGTAYAVIGGVAVQLYSREPRTTLDVDLAVRRFSDIPRGALIGYDAEEDARRHTVTDSGVVVVTTDDEPLIGQLGEEALRFEAEADRRGGGD